EMPALEQLSCWHQLLEVITASQDYVAAETPFLFQLDDPSLWSVLVGEVRRLGQGRPWSWRETDDGHLLVRVVGPPYCSLLRALEGNGQPAKLQVFVEQAPRVWAELGGRQPLVEQIQPPAGQILFIRRPRRWWVQDDEPFQEEVDGFSLGASAANWSEGARDCRLKPSLRLVVWPANEPANLWVLRRGALEQLSGLLREADGALLAGLQVAISH